MCWIKFIYRNTFLFVNNKKTAALVVEEISQFYKMQQYLKNMQKVTRNLRNTRNT